MNKTYRIELLNQKTNQKVLYGYFTRDIEQIEKAMKNNIVNHPLILIYPKTGKTLLKTIQG